MLETQKTQQTTSLPFAFLNVKDGERQALPSGENPFASLMLAMGQLPAQASGSQVMARLPGDSSLSPQDLSDALMNGSAIEGALTPANASEFVMQQLAALQKPVNLPNTQPLAAESETGTQLSAPGLVNLTLPQDGSAVPVEQLLSPHVDADVAKTQNSDQVSVFQTPEMALNNVDSGQLASVSVPVVDSAPHEGSIGMMTQGTLASSTANGISAEDSSVSPETLNKAGLQTMKSFGESLDAFAGSSGAKTSRQVFGGATVPSSTVPSGMTSPQQATSQSMTAQQVESLQQGTPEALNSVQGQSLQTSGDDGVESAFKGSLGTEKTALKFEKTDVLTAWGSQSQAVSNATSQQANLGQGSSQQQPNPQMQQFVAQAQQQAAQQVIEQQTKTKFSEEMTAAKNNESLDKDKLTSLIGDLGTSFDKRGQLPLGLQSINTPVRHPQWGQALGQRVVVMANQKIQEAKITLNPEKLGPVQIKLHMDKDQHIHVSMLAQHGTTREAMENAIPKLKDMLEQAGISFGSVDVGDQSQFEQAKEQQATYAKSRGVSSGGELEQESVETPNLLQSQTNNLIDYYA